MIERGEILAAWRVAAEVTAAFYAITAADIMAPSRGRGPKPPRAVCEAKKLAVHLVVILIDRLTYSELAAAIGLHKDTVASHCAWAREASAVDPRIEDNAATLEMGARARMRALADAPGVRIAVDRALAARNALHAYAEELARNLAVHPSHPTDFEPHGNVIKIARNR